MATTSAERLALVYAAYQTAFERRPADLRQAQTAEQAQAVLANVDALERNYLDAAKQELDANGPDIEAAYQAARDASGAVEHAYAEGQELSARISAVAGVVTAVETLVTKAASA